MFTKREMKLLEDGYFYIVRIEQNYIELISYNTRHSWIIFRKPSEVDKPITLYHKHTLATQYYHKHWETWNVAMAVDSIKHHDAYVIRQRERGVTVRKGQR